MAASAPQPISSWKCSCNKYYTDDFYDVPEVIKDYDRLGSAYGPRTNGRRQQQSVDFLLSADVLAALHPSDNNDTSGAEIQFRIWSDGVSPRKDRFLEGFMLKVNHSDIITPCHDDAPCFVDITQFCFDIPMERNSIDVFWVESWKTYTYSIVLVRKLTVDSLMSRERRECGHSADDTLALVRETFADGSDLLATTSFNVSLLCPISKRRMTDPCRGLGCKHVQCFDGTTYLLMNKQKRKWRCPVCDEADVWPFIDALFVKILAECTTGNEVVFSPDGSWKPYGSLKSDSPVSTRPIVIDLTVDSSSESTTIDSDSSDDGSSTNGESSVADSTL